MVSSRTNHSNVRDPASSTDGTGMESRHNPQDSSFTSQSWLDKVKQQERSSCNIAPNLKNVFDAQNVQSYFSQTTPFLEATEPYSILMDRAQLEGLTFDDGKELNEVLRAVGKTENLLQIFSINEDGRMAALNGPFNIGNKAIVVSPILGSGARMV